jgi:hypothetical protein
MTSELRYVMFQPSEAAQAISEYYSRNGNPLPAGPIVQCGPEIECAGAPVRFRIKLAPNLGVGLRSKIGDERRREVVIEGPALAAALILYCRERKIPLAANAAKSLQILDNQICLVASINRMPDAPFARSRDQT